MRKLHWQNIGKHAPVCDWLPFIKLAAHGTRRKAHNMQQQWQNSNGGGGKCKLKQGEVLYTARNAQSDDLHTQTDLFYMQVIIFICLYSNNYNIWA